MLVSGLTKRQKYHIAKRKEIPMEEIKRERLKKILDQAEVEGADWLYFGLSSTTPKWVLFSAFHFIYIQVAASSKCNHFYLLSISKKPTTELLLLLDSPG